jgi:hypothetical protein
MDYGSILIEADRLWSRRAPLPFHRALRIPSLWKITSTSASLPFDLMQARLEHKRRAKRYEKRNPTNSDGAVPMMTHPVEAYS